MITMKNYAATSSAAGDEEPFTATLSFVNSGMGGEGPTLPRSGQPGLLPVSGSNPLALDCSVRSTLLLSPISQATFSQVMCGFKAMLSEEFFSSLPAALPDGSTFVEGMTITVFKGDEPASLPANVTVDIKFFPPQNLDANAPSTFISGMLH